MRDFLACSSETGDDGVQWGLEASEALTDGKERCLETSALDG